jgi:hypothetical protein
VAEVLECFARHFELRAIVVEFAKVDYQTPLVDTGLGDEKYAGDVAGIVGALPDSACFES